MDLARVRWDNLAKLGAVLSVLALVVLWPRLGADVPAVPDGRVRDVARAAPPPRSRPRSPQPPRLGRNTRPRHEKRSPSGESRRRRSASAGGNKRRTDEKGSPTVAARAPARPPRPPRPAPAPAPAPAQPAPAPAPTPPSSAATAAAEFGVD